MALLAWLFFLLIALLKELLKLKVTQDKHSLLITYFEFKIFFHLTPGKYNIFCF